MGEVCKVCRADSSLFQAKKNQNFNKILTSFVYTGYFTADIMGMMT